MSAEITVGSTLGGRYLVTAEVVATAEGDTVFDGMDQVLNRPVSLLVAAPANATRMAVSAREIAMGTRPSEVQVLDLGLNADSTYLIANLSDPASLLDLVVEADAPYIEPFQTDTLGQEIFGEPRSLEPQVYEDDAEYYQELAAEQQRRPIFGRLFGKRSDEPFDAEAAPATAPTPLVDPSSPEAAGPAGYAGVADAGNAAPPTGPFAAAPQSAAEAARAASRAREAAGNVDGGASSPETAEGASATPPVPPAAPEAEDSRPSAIVPPVTPLPPVGAPSTPRDAKAGAETRLSSDEQAARAAAERGPQARAAARFPREAAGAAAGQAHGQTGAALPTADNARVAAAADDVLARVPVGASGGSGQREDGDSHRWTRLLVGLVLVAVLVAGVVVAVKALGGGNAAPTAGPSSHTTSAAAAPSESGDASSQAPAAAKPKVASVELVAPAESQWSNLFDAGRTSPENAADGEASTRFSTYSYKTPSFGNFFKDFTLMIKLDKPVDVSSVTMSGLGGTGGEVQVSVGDTPSASAAKDVFSGSFSGATLEAPTVNGGKPVQGQYVFITVSELPRLAAPSSPDRPYGFQVSEIKVS